MTDIKRSLAPYQNMAKMMLQSGGSEVGFEFINGWDTLTGFQTKMVVNGSQGLLFGVMTNNVDPLPKDFIKIDSQLDIVGGNGLAFDIAKDNPEMVDIVLSNGTFSFKSQSEVIGIAIFSANFIVAAKNLTDKDKVRQFFDFSFPELGDNLDAEFDFFYDQFSKVLTKKNWRNSWTEGMAYRIAHAIAMRNIAKKSKDGTGAVPQNATSKTVGKLSIGYGANTGDDAYAGAGEYGLTIYGRHYWLLLNKSVPVGMVV